MWPIISVLSHKTSPTVIKPVFRDHLSYVTLFQHSFGSHMTVFTCMPNMVEYIMQEIKKLVFISIIITPYIGILDFWLVDSLCIFHEFVFILNEVFAEEIHLFPLCDVVFAICFFFYPHEHLCRGIHFISLCAIYLQFSFFIRPACEHLCISETTVFHVLCKF